MPTLEAVKLWLTDTLSAAKKSARTIEHYCYIIDRFLRYLAASHLPTELELIKPAHVRQFLANVKVSGSTLLTFDRTLRAIFTRIEREGIEDFSLPDTWQSPFKKVERIKHRAKPRLPLSVEQTQQLLTVQPKRGYINARNFAELNLLLQTGLRASELSELQLKDCDLANRQLKVRGKGNKTRMVYLSTRVTRVLLAYLNRRGERGTYLFPTRDGLMQSRRAVHRTVRIAGRRAGLHLHPHLLRHTYISTALNVKHAPMRFVQDQVGHEDVRTTMGYNHVPDGEARKLADEFSVL